MRIQLYYKALRRQYNKTTEALRKKWPKNFHKPNKSINFAAQRAKKLTYCPGGGMVDALVSGASAARRAGSSPVLGTVNSC